MFLVFDRVVTRSTKRYSVLSVEPQRRSTGPFIDMMCLQFTFTLTIWHLTHKFISFVDSCSPFLVDWIIIVSFHLCTQPLLF